MKKEKSNRLPKGSMKPYEALLDEINQISYYSLCDIELKEKSKQLMAQAQKGQSLDVLLPEAFALVREAAARVLGMRPFDVQVMAAIALHQGKIVEMQTGEGKTLTATMPAYLNALGGFGVHVLTFNDYLAVRDAVWMGPLYKFLGLSVGFVKEGMTEAQRQEAYGADITYVTAKEADFDYLRDFLCSDQKALVHRDFHYAIVDEADSILIDEARIPLVIAGNMPQRLEEYTQLRNLVSKLKAEDYEIDAYNGTVCMTDQGLHRAEKNLGCGNLYDSRNLELLARLNSTLYAETMLRRDRDYVVKNGKVEIVDEFTGRIADKRHWPDHLQAAVEAKEGILTGSKGMILGSIPLQYFVKLYPKLAGMTGTAASSAEELQEFYELETVVIPTNRPCIRIDHEDRVYLTKGEKLQAVAAEVVRVHRKGQPVLLGTGSVEESEELAELLRGMEIDCKVLNAKNDEQEAAIIAGAGALGAVTVSTNMAGRGVDIKLGGAQEQDPDRVAALGGLYVIGTNRHESRRIDNQLKGRAGRQGDPGESRFFLSLEDDWLQRYQVLKNASPKYLIPEPETNCLPKVAPLIARGQRLMEGYNSDIRRQLWRYSYLLEQQRRILHRRRQNILGDKEKLQLLRQKAGLRYEELCQRYGSDVPDKVEKQLTLYYINKHWSEYLDYISYIRESIHLVVLGKQNPLFEYNKLAVQAFDEMQTEIEEDILRAFEGAEITEEGIDMEREGMKAPSATWTYLISDSPEQFSNLPFLMKAISNAVKGPLFTISSLSKKLLKHWHK